MMKTYLLLLLRDKAATVSAAFLSVVLFCAVFGPDLVGDLAATMNLRMRNAPPFSLENGWMYVLGADSLGRSILARLIAASQSTMLVAACAVVLSLTVGAVLGLIAGLRGGFVGNCIMRFADVIMSFPSLLLALIFLYILSPSLMNVMLVLAITRIPVFLRTVRAEVLEVKERLFVVAARVLGASWWRMTLRHVLPMVLPTLLTLATLEFAFIMLAEASLSFLGLGIQPPGVSWGLMVAEGRNLLTTAWWLSFWPGLTIMLTTISLNLMSNWLRVVLDPKQRWRLEKASSGEVVKYEEDARAL